MSFIRKIKKKNAIYLAEVKTERIKGKVVQKFIRYIGKEVNGKQILSASASDIEIDSVKIYGPLILLHSLAKSIKLPDILGSYSHEILSMVYAHCVEPKSVNKMPDWFKKTDLNHILNLEGLTERKLLEAIDSIEKTGREELQVKIFSEVQKKYDLNLSSVFYDVTNTYLYGKKCPLGKLGHSKHGKNGKPLVQIGLAVTRNDGIPIFHTVYDGNVHDARTLQDGLTMFNKMGIKDIIIVYDRGITSKEGISSLKRRKLGSICGVPIRGELKKIIQEYAREKKIVQIENRVKMSKNTFYVIGRRYKINDISGKILICYNKKMKEDIRESRYDEIIHAQKQLKAGKGIKEGLGKYLTDEGELNKKAISEGEELDGYSCLFCTKELPNHIVIKRYFEKDLVEKAFRSLNGVASLRPIRHWLYDRVVGHIFICYLAYLLLTLLENRLEKTNLDISSTEAMREMETMYKIYMKGKNKEFKLDRVVKMTKVQEKILRGVDKSLLKV